LPGQALLELKPVNIADVLASYRSSVGQRMSAFGGKADMAIALRNVR
jgi:hypothetical protein